MRKLTKSVEKRIAIQLGLDREEVRKAVFLSEKEHPEFILVPDGAGKFKRGIAVTFPLHSEKPEDDTILIDSDWFVKDGA